MFVLLLDQAPIGRTGGGDVECLFSSPRTISTSSMRYIAAMYTSCTVTVAASRQICQAQFTSPRRDDLLQQFHRRLPKAYTRRR